MGNICKVWSIEIDSSFVWSIMMPVAATCTICNQISPLAGKTPSALREPVQMHKIICKYEKCIVKMNWAMTEFLPKDPRSPISPLISSFSTKAYHQS